MAEGEAGDGSGMAMRIVAESARLLGAPRPLHPRALVPGFALTRLDPAPARWTGALEAWVRAA